MVERIPSDLEIAILRMSNLMITWQDRMPIAFLGDLSLLVVAAKDGKEGELLRRLNSMCVDAAKIKDVEKAETAAEFTRQVKAAIKFTEIEYRDTL